MTPTVSNNSVLTAQASNGVLPGTYSVNVISVGSPTDAISNNGLTTVTDPTTQSISSSSAFTLTVGSSTYTINPSGNSLNALAQAINASGAGVNATVVNVGSNSAPDYRLALETAKLGNIAVQLNDGSSDLLNTVSTGTQAQYQVNGQPSTPISSDSDTVTIAPGLNVTLQGTGSTTISVGQSTSGIENALSSFVTAYNAAIDGLNQQHGSAGGALNGQAIIFSLEQSLRSFTGYSSGSGAVQSLADLGLTVDSSGKLSFSTTQFESVLSSNASAVTKFFGSATTSGFLQAATNTLTGIEDPTNGTLQQDLATIQTQITKTDTQINDEQSRVDTLQSTLTNQLAKADAAIAQMQSQVTYYTSLFSSIPNNGKTG